LNISSSESCPMAFSISITVCIGKHYQFDTENQARYFLAERRDGMF
jgi:hypothetical protein